MRGVSGRALARAASGWIAVACLAALAVAAGGTGGAITAPGTAAAARLLQVAAGTAPQVALPQSLIPAVGMARDEGPVDPAARLRFGLLLSDPYSAQEQQLNRAIYSPGSPLYHRFLTPSEYTARFGAGQALTWAVRAYLARAGLTVSYRSSAGRYWLATGSAAQIERLFSTPIDRFQLGGESFWANTAAPRVPAALGVQYVLLNDALQAHSDIQRPKPGYVFPFGFPLITIGPSDLWSLYDAPATNTGQGQQLAVSGWGKGDSLQADLRQYETEQGLPQIPGFRVVYPSGEGTDTSGQAEWDLDEDASTGMAPGAAGITFYMATTNAFNDLNAVLQAWADDSSGALQMSASWGACEDNPVVGAGNSVAEEAATGQAVLEGRTLFASSGDTGFGCPVGVNTNGVAPSPLPLQEMPASDPNVVAVGGTIVYPDPTSPTNKPARLAEHAWEYTGGGPSFFQKQPDYQGQTGLGGAVMTPCVSDVGGTVSVPPNTCRGVPDVAIVSGDVSIERYQIVSAGADSYEAGTSLSAPVWQGVWERIQAAAPLNPATGTYSGLGFANRMIYPEAEGANYASDFNDITLGSNGLWTAAPGWDYVSGWGTPDVAHLMQNLSGSLVPANPSGGGGGGGGGTGGGGGGTPQPRTYAGACAPLWTHPAGSDRDPILSLPDQLSPVPPPAEPPGAHGANPQLNLLRGDFALTPDGQTLQVRLTLDNLSKTVPAPYQGNEYFGLWTYKGTTYYVNAEVDTSGTVSYFYGTFAGNSYTPLGSASGSFGGGPDGVVEVDVPLSKVGGPQVDDQLTNTGAETALLAGFPATNDPVGSPNSFGGFLTVDQSPTDANGAYTGRTYYVAERCSAPAVTVTAISAPEAQVFSGTVASVSDPRLSDQASDLRASIDWGDGSTSTGAITGSAGSFTVSAAHTWAEEGAYPVAVIVEQATDPTRPAGIGTGAATLSDSDVLTVSVLKKLRMSGATFSGVLATVTDSIAARQASGLVVLIDWGDGTTSNGVLSGGPGQFSISGQHTYAHPGPQTVTITVSDPGGSSAQGQGPIRPGGHS